MLKNNKIPYRELTQEDKEIEQYPTCSKFLIMEPNDFLRPLRGQSPLTSPQSGRVHYIDLEKLLKIHFT